MAYLFTSESVSEGHPDKVSDQISDAILDAFLAQDASAKVACETLVTTGLAVVAGEVKSEKYVDVQTVVRNTIEEIGYTKSDYQFDYKSCGVLSAIHEQSPEINAAVVDRENQGAGDQGIMFGYASNETDSYMPLTLAISHMLLKELSLLRRAGGEMAYLRPDAKSQVTIRYSDNHAPEAITAIVVSTQHDPESEGLSGAALQTKIAEDIKNIVVPRVKAKLPARVHPLFDAGEIVYHINPSGAFVIGGPHGDTGLTGRKIIVDTYGGRGAHGGGAFSGKDPSKVDRSAAYAARHMAKNAVAAGLSDQILVQVAYAIGVAEPMGVYVNTYGSAKVAMSDGEIAAKLEGMFDLRPGKLIDNLKLLNPIYGPTASYGHFGREPETVTRKIQFGASPNDVIEREVELFTWEKLDRVADLKAAFSL